MTDDPQSGTPTGSPPPGPDDEDALDTLLEVGESAPRSSPAAPRPRRAIGCLVGLVALAVLVGGGYLLFTAAMDRIGGAFAGPEDYEGSGVGRVVFEVAEGDTAAEIGRNLKDEGVVKSVEAFTEAAADEPESRGIQVGFYQLRKEMAAEEALALLIDPANLVQDLVTVPEGLTVDQIVSVLAKNTKFKARQYRAALSRPDELGLPDYADGDPEGYLFPATYAVRPGATAQSILAQMVDRWRVAADQADLESRARSLGYSPAEVMVVASLVEAEASRARDRARVARVIYNRLEGDETNGLLQIDATVNYAHGRNLGAVTTLADLEIDSPYNTYKYPGLPPTPIEAPGDAAIEAAANPADGDWYYYVTVNLRTGETKFAQSYQQFLRYKDELRAYCANESDAC